MGNLLLKLKDHNLALHYYQNCLKIFENMPNKIKPSSYQEMIMVMCNIGNLYTQIKEFYNAIQHQEKAKQMCKLINGEKSVKYGDILLAQSETYIQSQNLQDAQQLLKQAQEIYKNCGGQDIKLQKIDQLLNNI